MPRKSVAILVNLLLLGALAAALHAQQTGQPALPEGAKVLQNLVYAQLPGKDLLLDLYLPQDSAGRLPVVMWIHGGGWRSGSKDRTPALRLISRGYAVASISYRLSHEAIFPAQIHDCKAAVRWLRANAAEYNLDADRIAAWGASAGGHLAALLGTSGGVEELEGALGNASHSSRVQAVVDFYGPTDFLRMDAAGSRIHHDAPDSPESRLIGGPIQDNKAKVARANPITYASKDDPPFLIMHGDQDPSVPHRQSQLLYEALKKAGVEVTFETVKGAGHGFRGPEIDRAVDTFLDKHFKRAEAPAGSAPVSAWLDPDKSEPAGTHYRTFSSKTIGGDVSYLIYLPPDYATQKRKRYPVIYWLHGLGGNQRSGSPFVAMLDHAVRAGQAPPMIVVLVNGLRDSMYCDSYDGETPVESVLVRDLVRHVERNYRTIPDRRARAIEGYSMGGFGAARLGFKYPDVFGAVSVMAGALHDEASLSARRKEIFEKVFGGDRGYFRSNSPWTLVEKNAGKIRGRTFVRIGVGAEDRLYSRNHACHRLLERLNIEHEFEVAPGVGHNRPLFYKTLGLERTFDFYRRAFAPSTGISSALIPASPRTYVVNQRHPNASDDAPGTADRPFKTISRAAELAQPGDTVFVREGVYRERVSPARGGEENRPITYLAAEDERVVVKGSEVWRPAWHAVAKHPGVFEGSLDPATFGEYNPYRFRLIDHKSPARPAGGPRYPRTLGQVFVDGAPYREMETLEDLYATPGTWMTSPQGDALYMHFDDSSRWPEDRLVEITVRGRIFAPHKRGLGHIHVKGFVFEHCANQFPSWGRAGFPQMGAVSTRSGHHWVLEKNTVRYAKTIGIDCGSEGMRDLEGDQPMPEVVGHHVIRNNYVTDNGLCGIAGFRHAGTRILSNVVERNNALGFKPGQWEQGGIKVHVFTDGLIEGNLVRDNDAYGIWLDNVYDRSRVTRNVIVNNLMAGIFVEMGAGPGLIDNNVVAYTRGGDGIYTHDASGVTIAHNLIYGNGGFGVWMHVATDRQVRAGGQRVMVGASGERILNNILIANESGVISLPFPFDRATDNVSDYNVLSPGGRVGESPLFAYNSSGGRVKMETIVDAFRKAIDADSALAHARPNLERWADQPYLSLAEWRSFSGNDRHSVTVKLRHPMLRSRVLDLELDLDDTLFRLPCQAVDGVDKDFFGRSISQSAPLLAGPFQNLRQGYNRIPLWPVAVEPVER